MTIVRRYDLEAIEAADCLMEMHPRAKKVRVSNYFGTHKFIFIHVFFIDFFYFFLLIFLFFIIIFLFKKKECWLTLFCFTLICFFDFAAVITMSDYVELLELPELEGSVVSKGDPLSEGDKRPDRTTKPLSPEK